MTTVALENHPATTVSAEKVPRVLYIAGRGDVLSTFRHWRDSSHDPSQVAHTYSGQFYEVCADLGLEAIVVAHHSNAARLVDGPFDIQCRPIRPLWARGPLYHVYQYMSNLRAVWQAVRHRCDWIIATNGSHLSPFLLARAFGIRVVLVAHCVLWPKRRRRRLLARIVRYLDGRVYRSGCDAILCVSKEISRQIEELTDGIHAPIVNFLPTYERSNFDGIAKADRSQRPFRVLFAGRVEENKGAFDLVEIAHRLSRKGRTDIIFEIAGEGGALKELQERIDSRGIGSMFSIHGYCLRHQMGELFQACHAVVVPTKSNFIEGFNKVVAEAVLSHRPYITSSVCPALNYVREAGIEVPPDNVGAYVDAIIQLADNDELYRTRADACQGLREMFFDSEVGWATALKSVLLNPAK